MSNPEFTAPDFTSQTAAAYKANIDASIAANGADSVNIAFSYASGTGTFTVHDAQGGALAATNPGFVKFQDPDNPGYYKYISVEANQDFIDDAGSSEIINNLFGLTTGVAYGNDLPFYLYAVSNDDMDAVAFMISRIPHATTSPAAANIGAPDDAVADANGDFFSLDSLDETLYDSNPCVCLGSFRMQMSASDDWTVQTLSAADGIGRFHEETVFTMAAGQFGNASGGYLRNNGGTAPAFSNQLCTFKISKSGNLIWNMRLDGDAGTDGSGSVSTLAGLPYTLVDRTGGDMYVGAIRYQTNDVNELGLAFHDDSTDVDYVRFYSPTDGAVLNSDFANGSRTLSGSFTFNISTN